MKTKLETKESQEEIVLRFIEKSTKCSVIEIASGTNIFKLNVHKILKKLIESGKVSVDNKTDPPTYSLINRVGENINTDKILKKVSVVKVKDEVALTQEGGRDTSKYIFNKIAYPKSRAVLEVIRQYIKDHPKITLQILQTVFKGNDLQKRYGTIIELSAAKKFETSSGRPRHFIKPTDIINVNGRKVVVSNQWDATNFEEFRKICAGLKYQIKKQ